MCQLCVSTYSCMATRSSARTGKTATVIAPDIVAEPPTAIH